YYLNEQLQLARSYDLLVGVTDAEAPCVFSDDESRNGVDPSRRDRILRTLVRNLYDYHQQVGERLAQSFGHIRTVFLLLSRPSSSPSSMNTLAGHRRAYLRSSETIARSMYSTRHSPSWPTRWWWRPRFKLLTFTPQASTRF